MSHQYMLSGGGAMTDLALCNAAALCSTDYISHVICKNHAMAPGHQSGPRAPYSYGGHTADPRFGPRSDDPRYGPRTDDRWSSGRQYTQDGHDRWNTILLAFVLSAVCPELGLRSLNVTHADP